MHHKHLARYERICQIVEATCAALRRKCRCEWASVGLAQSPLAFGAPAGWEETLWKY